MKNKKLTVTIGIPAYNEEANIKYLLKSLLAQKIKRATLLEIVVVSDGSTDDTVLTAKTIADNRVKVINRKQRYGVLKTQNEIVGLSRSDILVLLDADVLPANNYFIEEIIKPIIKDKSIGLVGADTASIKPKTFFERLISDSHQFKTDVYKKIRNKNNIYLCHGRARAFSKNLYSIIRWPDLPPEDAYSYLFCISKGFKFLFAPKAKIIFRSPATFKDHMRQSIRFFIGRNQMEKYFPADFVRKQYQIPASIFWLTFAEHLIKNPVTLSAYLLIFSYIRIISLRKSVQKVAWDVSASSKRIIYENTK